ncbi:ester cyclase [Jannaschia sp. Os4]|uniref:ester cyclase n=1 Tax=Jannaschia sp. Os4 TaxID=2807617 RepID=UPI0019393BEF|nr:ester cyclase [Jannaschia sp. Os4]MBM2576403.1 ester cyclase [Jannaschia sp. Os4]
MTLRTTFLALACAALPIAAAAQEITGPNVSQIRTHMGEMAVSVRVAEGMDREVTDRLRFEPYQQLIDIFTRGDLVFLMRHGPTDWSKLDEPNVAPTDCANQRVMSPEGRANMRDMGTLLASNDIVPARIVVSEWCRNQQTVDSLLRGMADVEPAIAEAIPVETTSDLNLLLSLQGSPDVSPLEARISAWEGDPERDGPLLIVSHYTSIEELTQFRVFEGEVLILDPKRDNLVLGYLRLRSAAPDVGHFADALASPLLSERQAFDMVERYYAALNAEDEAQMSDMLAEDWIGYGLAAGPDGIDAGQLFNVIDSNRAGMSDMAYVVDDVHVSGDVVTVIGQVTGTHTGELLGIPATGREVAFKSIAVHRVENGQIAESWITSDRLELLEQIGG